MRHRVSGRKFGRPTAQKMALLNSLSRSLFKYEQIVTTLPKAKDLRPYVEKMLTVGKNATLANRRRLFAKLRDDALVSKICGPLASRYSQRNGGYTRIVKCGFRQGDMAPMAVIQLLDSDAEVAEKNSAKAGSSVAENTASEVK